MTDDPASGGGLFAAFPPTAAEHFRLHFFGAVLACLDYEVSCADSPDDALARHPFLVGYNNELAQLLEGVDSAAAQEQWRVALERWEQPIAAFLPLQRLRRLLDTSTAGAMCLLTAGLAEEDARFGSLFETHQNPAGQRRCTLGLLRAIWRRQLDGAEFSRLWRQAARLGLAQFTNPGAASPDLAVQLSAAAWSALRGEGAPAGELVPWARLVPSASLPALADLILPAATLSAARAVPALLAARSASGVIVRGATHGGRRTLLRALARELGQGVLELKTADAIEEARWHEFAALAALTNAFPIVALELGAGETRAIPDDWPAGLPLGIALRAHGAITGDIAGQAIALHLAAPDCATRERHWARALPSLPVDERRELSHRFRLPAGQIHRAAQGARTNAALARRSEPTAEDITAAMRALNRQRLDALARHCTVEGDWSHLCVSADTLRELGHLESHCRQRERLPALLDRERSAGVRALFSGPSGTGKSHAARLLAAALRKDIYQLNLAEIVNKFVGETEKNLQRVLDAGEELDVILLLDEGDALLTQRTDVHSSNDRFGNLQTNFLLQRLDRYEGILIVTTNARTRIDPAFERRMDVTVEFHAPDPAERWALWQLHLPAPHDVHADFLEDVATRCELTGGQIRNAALHAALLALDLGGVIRTADVESAVRREYAKLGGVCPLRHVLEFA